MWIAFLLQSLFRYTTNTITRYVFGALKLAPGLNEHDVLTVVVPTLNEAQNIGPLVQKLQYRAYRFRVGVIFVDVDDSTDGTADVFRSIFALPTPASRILQRIGRRGLASPASKECSASAAPYLASMDADFSMTRGLFPPCTSIFARRAWTS